jgi:hypothetical protein
MLAWLDTQLPPIAAQIVNGLADQMVAQITSAVRLKLVPRLHLAIEAEHSPEQDATPP